MSLLLKTVTGGVTRNQPQGNASIDWENPLTKGLVFDMTASVGPINIVKNVMATSTTGMSTLPSTGGLGYKVTQSAGNCIFFSNQTALLNSFPFSLLFIADTVAEANRKFVFQHGQDTGSAAARVWVLFNGTATAGSHSDASGKLYLYTIDTSLNQTSPAAGGIAGAIITGVHQYGITCDGTTTSYYRDGVLLGTESPTNTNNVWDSSSIVSIGGRSPALSNTRTYDRSLLHVRVWNGRLLTKTDFLRLFENPWQIYSPRTRDKWITPTISGGPTYTLTASTGTFTLTGNTTGLQASRNISTNVGTFTLTGNATGLQTGRNIAASVGTFTLTGNAANLVYTPSGGATYTLTATSGSFSLTGNNASLVASRKIATTVGTFTLNGISNAFLLQHTIAPSVGSFVLNGNTTNLKVSRQLALSTGTFTLTGNSVTFTAGSAFAFSKYNRQILDLGGIIIMLGNSGLDSWGTATRPTSPKKGTAGLNLQLSAIEIYDGNSWKSVSVI
jgi:hypothetical protein